MRKTSLDHVLRTENIRLHRFVRIVLRADDMLQRRAMKYDVHAFHRVHEPLLIAYVAEQQTQTRIVVQALAEIKLF